MDELPPMTDVIGHAFVGGYGGSTSRLHPGYDAMAFGEIVVE